MLTKSQLKIMQLFASKITGNFSLIDVSRSLKMQYKVVYRAMKVLVERKYIIADNKRYKLNYKENHQVLSFVEFLRADELLGERKNGILSLFVSDMIKKIKEEHFVLIVFGSTVENNGSAKPRDVDILLIVDNIDKVESVERQVQVISKIFTLKFDINVVSYESVYEMLEKREQMNVINEVLNKHIIVHGSEIFYRMLSKGRR